MTDNVNDHRNTALWAGSVLMVVALLSNGLYFLRLPGQALLPWVCLALAGLAFLCLVIGAKRAFATPQVYRGKVAGSILTVVSGLLFGFAIFAFIMARNIPAVNGAPSVGQKAPDFSLTDTGGQTITLAQLLSTPGQGSASARPPKAVLLVFYRGYW